MNNSQIEKIKLKHYRDFYKLNIISIIFLKDSL